MTINFSKHSISSPLPLGEGKGEGENAMPSAFLHPTLPEWSEKMSGFLKKGPRRCAAATLLLLIVFVANANCSLADESLDQLLTTAMENHPYIVAAKARVALAEAELNATRLQVARQIIALWGERNAQDIAIGIVHRQLTEENLPAEKRSMLIKSAEDARIKKEQIEAEIKFLTARAAMPPPPQGLGGGFNDGFPPQSAQPKPLQIPSGPIVEEAGRLFRKGTIEFGFVETPLQQVMDYMKDTLKFPIFLDNRPLNEIGISSDTPITINMHQTPLPAALQAFQDQNQELIFVIRDYGLLLTTIDQAEMQGYFPALEFAKSLGKEKTPEAKPAPGPNPFHPAGR